MTWHGSDRNQRLPPNWHTIRKAVKDRAAGHCQATRHHPDCNRTGTDADHITPGDNHTLANLQWLSEPCHRAKTATDNAQANRQRARLRRRPTEPHPGRITP